MVNMLYGVDGVKGGWVVAQASIGLEDIELRIEIDLERLFQEVSDSGGLLVIDVPIGLPDCSPRKCDQAARERLGFPRSTSVFSAPMRPSLVAESYQEACDLNQAASGRRLSRQSYAILPKIREVDSLMTPMRQKCIYEAHPEVTFMELNGGRRGLPNNKKKAAGRAERLAILRGWISDIGTRPFHASAGDVRAQPDDIHDALACLVTAARIGAGDAVRLPEHHHETDATGLRMEILA